LGYVIVHTKMKLSLNMLMKSDTFLTKSSLFYKTYLYF
jgi:hypothetical protein